MIFRYPGGKKRFRTAIMRLAPARYSEYREPFVGGGATFFGVPTGIARWINDRDTSLMEVYRALRDRPVQFIEACRAIEPMRRGEGPERLQAAFDRFVEDKRDEALAYYFLNRTSWGGYQNACTTLLAAPPRRSGAWSGANVSGGRRACSRA